MSAGLVSKRPGLSGKRAVVTGGANGIGAAIAANLTASGTCVVVADIDPNVTELDRDGETFGFACDVGDPEAVSSLFEYVDATLGGLDFLINNTGIAGPTAIADEVSVADWENVIRVNISSMFYCVRKALPMMREAGGGVIVNFSSAAIRRSGFPMRLPYATSKAAVLGFTETLAMEAGPDGIRVHTLMPGTVNGPRVDAVIASRSKATGIPESSLRQEVLNMTSLRTNIEADDIASTVNFLCSDYARFMSGQTISVCGHFEGHRSAATV